VPPPADTIAAKTQAAESSADTPTPTVPSGTKPPGTESSGTPSPDGKDSKDSKPAGTTTVSPAAFAWEMPDPPPESRSSPARAFLRSDTSAKARRAPGPAAANPGKIASANSGKTASVDPGRTTSASSGKTAPGEAASRVRSLPQQTAPKRSARQAHLTVARVEPWSVMKFSFVVSLVAFVILFVAVTLLYGVLSGLGVFDSLQRVVNSVTSSQTSSGVNAKAWFSASRVLGYTALLGSLNIVLITAMSTIGSVVYNLTSRLVGGVEVTLRETE
jgi:hypothetical protein